MKGFLAAGMALTLLTGTALASEKFEGNRPAGFQETKVAAEKGNPVAQNNLAVMLATGSGVTQDVKAAAKWYEKAAEQGYAVAQHNLGGLYEQGLGVTQDFGAAAVWYALAAEQGDGWAQLSLAELHATNKLVQSEPATAYRWLLIAANSKEPEVKAAASDALKKVAPKLSAAQKTEAEKMAKVWRPNR